MKHIEMPLRRYLKSFFGRRDHEQDALYDGQDGNEVIASVESSCVCATKRKLNFFRKSKNILKGLGHHPLIR